MPARSGTQQARLPSVATMAWDDREQSRRRPRTLRIVCEAVAGLPSDRARDAGKSDRPRRRRTGRTRTIAPSRGCRTKKWPCRKATNARRPSQDRGRVRLPRGDRPLCWTDLIPAKIELLSISYHFAPAAGFARQPLANAIARREAAGRRKRSCRPRQPDARDWANSKARHRSRDAGSGRSECRRSARPEEPHRFVKAIAVARR